METRTLKMTRDEIRIIERVLTQTRSQRKRETEEIWKKDQFMKEMCEKEIKEISRILPKIQKAFYEMEEI